MKKILLLLIVVVLLAVGWYGYRLFNARTPDFSARTPDHRIEAQALIAAFEQDTAAARRLYDGKILAVTGMVKAVDSTGVITLGDPESQSSVVCALDNRHTDDARKVQAGARVTVTGVCSGFRAEEMLGLSLGTNVELAMSGLTTDNN